MGRGIGFVSGNPKCYTPCKVQSDYAPYHRDLLMKRMFRLRDVKNMEYSEVAEWVKSLGQDYADKYWFDSVSQMQNWLLEILY